MLGGGDVCNEHFCKARRAAKDGGADIDEEWLDVLPKSRGLELDAKSAQHALNRGRLLAEDDAEDLVQRLEHELRGRTMRLMPP